MYLKMLGKALALPEDAEAVAWLCTDEFGNKFAAVNDHQLDVYVRAGRKIEPLYPHQPQADAERVALVERIDTHINTDYIPMQAVDDLLTDIRAYLTGGDA
jgi:hypothetical protein